MLYHARMGIRGLLLDLDGTLYVGGEPVAGAREAVGSLKASGLRSVRHQHHQEAAPVGVSSGCGLGFEVEEAEIFTPARAAAGMIGDWSCFALVDESLYEDLGRARPHR